MDQHHPQLDWGTCQLLVALHELYVLPTQSHFLCLFERAIPLTKLYGVTPDISIIMMYTFYQYVYYTSHNKSFPSTSEEKHAFWVGFGEHVSDATTNSWTPPTARSSTDLFFVQLMTFIQTSIY